MTARIVPAGIGVAEAAIGDHSADLFPEEAAHIAKAVPKRRDEFSTGRVLARRALRAVGGPAIAIPAGAHWAPIWPTGFVGSITHSTLCAAAAVGRVEDFQGIGIDLEIISRVSMTFVPKIATVQETELLHASAEPIRHLALLYSAKESWFKCQYPLTGAYLGFKDVVILLDWANGEFQVRSTLDAKRSDFEQRTRGRFTFDDHHVATAATLAR
ncbi:MAG TPA: 4'-phosphopantetheinyl transferase superfamily protein [Xanthobacteraceae bacterium]|nr:4'-phosphopantetheinyl transferase superfamily protein [Xanthobacteraceae bacterium]